MNDFRDDFLQIQNVPDQWLPKIKTRKIEQIKIGTWFFGLLPVYELRFTQWEEK